jgi:lambda family phage portal protein
MSTATNPFAFTGNAELSLGAMPVRDYSASLDGGVQTRLDSPWPRQTTTSRAFADHDAGNFASLRDRARNLEAVNWLACGMLDRAVENVIGTTFRVEPRCVAGEDDKAKTLARAFNKMRSRRWRKWAGTTKCDVRGLYTFGGLLRMAYRAVLRDGDIGIVLVATPYWDGTRNKRKPQLQLIEGDRICDPASVYDGYLPNGNPCVGGVEMSSAGAPIAYHVKWRDRAGQDRWERIEARDMVFLRRGTRYTNVRGETVFRGEGFRIFEQLAGVIDAVVVAWRAGASQAIIHTSDNPQQAQQGLQSMIVVRPGGASSTSTTTQERNMPIQPGMINFVKTGGSITAFDPKQPQQNLPEAINAFARILGVKFGLTLERVLLNFSLTTYSSGKMANNQEKATAAIEQDDLAATAVSRIYQWWCGIEEDNGDVVVPAEIEDGWAHEWIPPYKPSPEPIKDLTAKKLAIGLGIESRSNAAMEDGYDFPELCEQNEADRALMRERGLPMEEEPEAASGKGEGGTTGKPDATAQPATLAQPLNGAQITAALDVMAKLRDKALTSDAAAELLQLIGVAPEKAKSMSQNVPGLDSAAGDVAWKREVLKSLLTVPQARESIYNATDIEDLISQTGLNPEKGYQAPYAAVVAPAGQLLSGETITDGAGDVVGGDVLPAGEEGGEQLNAGGNGTAAAAPKQAKGEDQGQQQQEQGNEPGSAQQRKGGLFHGLRSLAGGLFRRNRK